MKTLVRLARVFASRHTRWYSTNTNTSSLKILVENVSKLWNEGKHQEAIQTLREGNDSNFLLKEKEGDMLMAIEDYNGAIDIYHQVLKNKEMNNTDKSLLYIRIGQCLSMMNKTFEAQEYFFEASKIDPSSELPYERLGYLFLEYASKRKMKYEINKYLDKSIEYFKEGLKKNNSNTDILYGLGIALQRRRRYDDAIDVFSDALNVNPKFYAALFNRGDCYFTAGKYRDALTDYEKFLQNLPEYLKEMAEHGNVLNSDEVLDELLYKTASCLLGLKDYPAAIERFNKYLEFNYENSRFKAMAYNKRGMCHYRMYNFNQCIKDNTKAIEIDRKYPYSWKDRAEAYECINMKEEAEYDKKMFQYLMREKFFQSPQ